MVDKDEEVEMIGELTKEEHDFMFYEPLSSEDYLDFDEEDCDDYDPDNDDMSLWEEI